MTNYLAKLYLCSRDYIANVTADMSGHTLLSVVYMGADKILITYTE